jgi:hypothetical protein
MLSISRTYAILAAAFALAAAAPAGAAAQARDTSYLVNEAAVTAALRSPEALWAFVTSPRTRWADRMAATFRTQPESRRLRQAEGDIRVSGMEIYGPAPAPPRFVLPISYMPRVAAALWELRRERALHNWGWRFRAPTTWRYASDTVAPPPFTGDRRRTILGHPWTVPAGAGFRPEGFGAVRGGPWPAHVETVMEMLLEGFQDPERPAEFYAAAARLPCADIERARWLVDLTLGMARETHVVTPAAVGVWRNLTLNPAPPEWPAWDDDVMAPIVLSASEEAFWLGQVLTVDVASIAGVERLRRAIRRVDWFASNGKIVRPGPPHAVHLALARAVDALPDSASPIMRATLARELLARVDPAAAATLPERFDDNRPSEAAFAAYRQWFARSQPALVRQAAAQEARLSAARRAMDAVTTCRAAR